MEAEVFRSALAAVPSAVRPAGVDRFFANGRLTVYPSRAADREAVLAHIAGRLMTPGRTVTETEVTVPADPSGTTCVEVLLVRENGQSSDAVRGCAP